ncbi:hypothetical protein ES332_D10G148000v1 [Gossypium tomentosum]|uniref:Uncharacterized protein n=1 Tax=Gossypium tomentosum TaxID=34277 RepID=A0A5D2J4E5_GOSTO|nr:hypothetical protein ES332_D10G148000v1 [Gossypium tomentosum]
MKVQRRRYGAWLKACGATFPEVREECDSESCGGAQKGSSCGASLLPLLRVFCSLRILG